MMLQRVSRVFLEVIVPLIPLFHHHQQPASSLNIQLNPHPKHRRRRNAKTEVASSLLRKETRKNKSKLIYIDNEVRFKSWELKIRYASTFLISTVIWNLRKDTLRILPASLIQIDLKRHTITFGESLVQFYFAIFEMCKTREAPRDLARKQFM